MTKYKFLLTILTFIASLGVVNAGVEKTPYSWEITTINIFPEGWTHVIDKADFNGRQKTVEYSTKTQQFIGSFSYTALVAPSQSLADNDNSPSEYKTVNDYLISPQLKGDLTFYVKRFSAMDEAAHKISSVRLFPAVKNADGSFTVDTAHEIATNFNSEILPLMKNDSEYHKMEVNLGGEYKYVAFRFDYVNVANLTAESAIMPDVRKLKLNYVEFSSGYSNPFKEDATGKVTVKCILNVKNEGNVTLDKDDAQYYGMLAVMDDDDNYSQFVKGKLPTLAPGAVGNAEIEFVFDMPEDCEEDSSGKKVVRVDGFISLDGQTDHKQIGRYSPTSIKVIPYTGILEVKYDNKTYTPGTADKPTYIDFGCFQGSKSVEVNLNNTGAAPLIITGVSAPQGVAFANLSSLPLTIDAGATLTETIIINGGSNVEGPISLTFNGTGTNTINVRGIRVAEDVAFQDFENGEIPNSWFAFENGAGKWAIYNNPVSSDKNNKKCLRHNKSSNLSSITTGRIHFNGDEKLNFDLALMSTYSGSLAVRISSDRTNWTEIANSNSGLSFPSKTNTWKSYSIDVPEGDWYVDFYGGYLYIDNVYGGKESPAAVEVIPLSNSTGNTAMVNYPLEFISTFHNLGAPLTGYQVRLVADDEVVADMPGEEFASGTDKSFSLSYYPHSAGEKTMKLELVPAVGDVVSSSLLTVAVEEEAEERLLKVGKQTSAEEAVPLNLHYSNSKSEFVYSADKLGIGKCRISGMGYDFYTLKNYDAKITKTRIWMQNTSESDTGDSFTSTDEMVLVYEYDGNPTWKRGGTATEMLRMGFEFDVPFEYTGGNLRVVIESNADNYCDTGFACEASNSKILYSGSDNADLFHAATPSSANVMPVTYFSTEKTAVIVSGIVSSNDGVARSGAGIEGVEIKAMAKDSDLLYVTTTGADGSYSLPIIQNDKEFVITASHPDYKTPETQDVDFTNPIHHFLLESISTGIEVIEEQLSGEACYYDMNGVKVENPGPGVYVRIINGKAKKIMVN